LTLASAHPWAIEAAPGLIPSVTLAVSRIVPALLTTSTSCPSRTPLVSQKAIGVDRVGVQRRVHVADEELRPTHTKLAFDIGWTGFLLCQ
jgi:hypothetical protein